MSIKHRKSAINNNKNVKITNYKKIKSIKISETNEKL